MKLFFAVAGTLVFFTGLVAPKGVILTMAAVLVIASWYAVFNDEDTEIW